VETILLWISIQTKTRIRLKFAHATDMAKVDVLQVSTPAASNLATPGPGQYDAPHLVIVSHIENVYTTSVCSFLLSDSLSETE
jgi:hypothetical protein